MIRGRKSLVALCAVAGVALSSQPASAAVAPPVAFFNRPLTGSQPASVPSPITAAIVALLNAAQPNSAVRIAIYTFKGMGGLPGTPTEDTGFILQAITDAQARQVAVRILVDKRQLAADVRDYLLNTAHVTALVECNGSCFHGGGGKMHDKFITASQILPAGASGVVNDVVLQMTANWTNPMLSSKAWNSAVQFSGDTTLFNRYVDVWQNMASCRSICTASAPSLRSFTGSSGVRVHVFPKLSASEDPMPGLINGIACPGDISVAMGSWADRRGIDLADLLASKGAPGSTCTVRVVVPYDIDPAVISKFINGVQVRCTDTENSDDLAASPYDLIPHIHSKYVLVAGTGGATVMTGSENFTADALLDNDDTWAVIPAGGKNDPLYAAYAADFNEIWNQSLPCGL